ncbi:MAG: hypothetical protein LBD41_08080 [Clostridiales Family XIII bacterium]|nr:hypothetical protein [Clostridiales Family XIII bacterium]
MINLIRTHHSCEYDKKWIEGKNIFDRCVTTSGQWRSYNKHITIESQTYPYSLHQDPLMTNYQKTLKEYYNKFASFRLTVKNDYRSVLYGKIFGEYNIKSFYLELSNQDITQSLLLPYNDVNDKIILDWLNQTKKYVKLPLHTSELDVKSIIFKPKAFGYLLHELLGHRLESDDFNTPITWKHFTELNFNVYDTIGEPSWIGYTPIDDMGIRGKNVCLLNGQNGQQTFMTPRSGNMRAVGYNWHPIIRQRCLVVDKLENNHCPEFANVLIIEDIKEASFLKNKAILLSNGQIFIDKANKQYRVPSLEITISMQSIPKLKAFGESQVTHPGGGCHKGPQKFLPISFRTPWAWIQTNRKLISIVYQ